MSSEPTSTSSINRNWSFDWTKRSRSDPRRDCDRVKTSGERRSEASKQSQKEAKHCTVELKPEVKERLRQFKDDLGHKNSFSEAIEWLLRYHAQHADGVQPTPEHVRTRRRVDEYDLNVQESLQRAAVANAELRKDLSSTFDNLRNSDGKEVEEATGVVDDTDADTIPLQDVLNQLGVASQSFANSAPPSSNNFDEFFLSSDDEEVMEASGQKPSGTDDGDSIPLQVFLDQLGSMDPQSSANCTRPIATEHLGSLKGYLVEHYNPAIFSYEDAHITPRCEREERYKAGSKAQSPDSGDDEPTAREIEEYLAEEATEAFSSDSNTREYTVAYAEEKQLILLTQLCNECPSCLRAGVPKQPMKPASVRVYKQCAFMKLQCTSSDLHVTTWSSSPTDRNGTRLLNRLGYFAALCTGMSYTAYNEFLLAMRMHPASMRDFYKFQNKGYEGGPSWVEVTEKVGQATLAAYAVAYAKGEHERTIVIDTRHDSSRNAEYGTVPFMQHESAMVLHQETRSKKEVGGNSWILEDHAVLGGIRKFKDAGVPIHEAIHDDKKSVDGILTRESIHSSKDLWHKCKNNDKKLKKELAEKGKKKIADIDECECRADVESCTAALLNAWLKKLCEELKLNAMEVLPKSGSKKEAVVDVVWEQLKKHKGKTDDGFEADEEGLEDGAVRLDTSKLAYPELRLHGVPAKLKGWIYKSCRVVEGDNAEALSRLIIQAADHWAGLHDDCGELCPQRKAETKEVVGNIVNQIIEISMGGEGDEGQAIEIVPHGKKPLYSAGGPTHLALTEFLRKNWRPSTAKHYTRARENYLIETLNSLINKYAPKAKFFRKSMNARVYCACMDWNENAMRAIKNITTRRVNQSNNVRERTGTNRLLVPKTTNWKHKIFVELF